MLRIKKLKEEAIEESNDKKNKVVADKKEIKSKKMN